VVRVLALTNWYPPHHFGGYELQCHDTMTRLEAKGHDVRVLCGDTRLSGGAAAPDPGHERGVRRTLRLYHDGSQLLRPAWHERFAVERHNQRELARMLDEFRPDVVSVWHLGGMSQNLLTPLVESGHPLVFVICDDWLVYGHRLDPWAGAFRRSRPRRLAGRVTERLTGVPCLVPDIGDAGSFLFVTEATEATALAKSGWTPRRRARFWGGIDRTVFRPATSRPRPWSWRLITTGRFDPRKGFETAIRALPLLPPEATLACWGRGGDDERDRLARIAGELGVADRVTFGTLERDELADEYRAADAMVFPSTWAEPFGLVPVEAMACGVPVMATGVGGSSEFLDEGENCLLFPAGDHTALAERLRRLGSDQALRERLAAGGLRTAAELDVEVLADVMESWHVYEASGRIGAPPAPRPRPGAGTRAA
jgi:glycosyltransferase involved in cell wall biosynthesis